MLAGGSTRRAAGSGGARQPAPGAAPARGRHRARSQAATHATTPGGDEGAEALHPVMPNRPPALSCSHKRVFEGLTHTNWQKRPSVTCRRVLDRRYKANEEVEQVDAEPVGHDVPPGAEPDPGRVEEQQSDKASPPPGTVRCHPVDEVLHALLQRPKNAPARTNRGAEHARALSMRDAWGIKGASSVGPVWRAAGPRKAGARGRRRRTEWPSLPPSRSARWALPSSMPPPWHPARLLSAGTASVRRERPGCASPRPVSPRHATRARVELRVL